MNKNILLVVFLAIILFVSGVLVGYKFAPAVSSPKTGGGTGNSPQTTVLGGPVVAVTQTVTGKVAQVDGKSMTIEAVGKSLVIKAGKTVAIIKPMAVTTKAPEIPTGTPSGTTKPDDNLQPDFNSVSVGSQITATLELQSDGTFLTKSVFLMPATVNK